MENENGNVGNQTSTGAEKRDFNQLMNEDKELQSFVDKKVSQGIATAVENAKKQWQLQQDTEKSEAEKLAQMNEKQKLEYEVQKANKEKADTLAELNAYKMKEQAIQIASEKGVDVTLLNLIDFKTITAEKLTEDIDNLSVVFNKAVEKAVNDRLKEDTPTSKTNGIAGSQPKPIPTVF